MKQRKLVWLTLGLGTALGLGATSVMAQRFVPLPTGQGSAPPAEMRWAQASSPQAVGQRPLQGGAPQPEMVPVLGDSQINYLDSLRASRRQALTRGPEPWFRANVKEAVLRHPEVRSAVSAVDGASAGTSEARAAYMPQISGQSEGGYRHYDANKLFSTPERKYSTGGIGLSLKQLVYDFGATAALVNSSEARERIAAARMEAKRAEIALRAVQAAIELDRSRQQLQLALENESARRAISAYVKERYELGGGSMSDVLRSDARVADAQAAIIAARTRLEASEAGYREIFGAVPANVSEVSAPVEVPGVNRTADLASGFASVRAAVAARESAQFDLKVVSARGMPQVNFEASVNRRDLLGTGTPGNDTIAGFNLRYDIYTGGALGAREAQALSRVRQAEEDYRSAVRGFERFADEVRADARSAEGLVAARIDAVDLAAQSLRAVREQFAFRRGTLLDLLTAQEVLQGAGRDLIDAYAQQVLASYRLLYVASRIDEHFGLAP